MVRRVFVGSVFAGMAWAARPPKVKAGLIPTRVFGKTGEKLTVIGQGGARLALLRTKDEACAHVRRALDLGINYFDCAASYWDGHSEEAYGEVLPAVRKKVFLTTKTTQRTRTGAEKELAVSLQRFKTDYLDLWQIHGVGTMQDVERIFAPGGALEAFEAAKKAGKVRFFGFTGHRDPLMHLEMLKRYDKWDSILMPLHAADPAYRSFEKQVLPEAVKRGMAIQAMKVFGNAFLLRVLNAKECLRYALTLPVHAAAVGCSTGGQLEDDARIAQEFKAMTGEEMEALRVRAVTAGPGGVSGTDLEYWKKDS